MKVLSVMTALVIAPATACAADDPELRALREQITRLQEHYEQRISALEQRLMQAVPSPTRPSVAAQPMEEAQPAASIQPAAPRSAHGNANPNTFNPSVSLVLSGLYGNTSQDPATYRLRGFHLPADLSAGLAASRGFSLAESELGFSAQVDHLFLGQLKLALDANHQAATEEAFIQTTALPKGLTLKAGRWYSGIGYLNEQHAHAWDFVDSPLAYQAFLGRQFKNDGVQLRWLAPTDTYLELGAELGRGNNFPGTDRNQNGSGASAIFAHLGGDVGISHSWRAGLSVLSTSPRDRQWSDFDTVGNEVVNRFSGKSRLLIADGVWKWAPNGDASSTSFKLQGEYLRRTETGNLSFDTLGTSAGSSQSQLSAIQSGWYVQGIYQFAPEWHMGLRADRLNTGSVDYDTLNANLLRPQGSPTRQSLMVDFKPSEFSKLRLQLSRDRSQLGVTDHQVFLQYQMSLGAHGAHRF